MCKRPVSDEALIKAVFSYIAVARFLIEALCYVVISAGEIRLFDVNNRETLRWNGNARRVSLDISALKPGVYAVRAVSGAKTVTRLVVRR